MISPTMLNYLSRQDQIIYVTESTDSFPLIVYTLILCIQVLVYPTVVLL